jgi:predicted RNA-binding protein with RPS1 domain
MPLEAGKRVIGKILDVTDKGLVVSLSDEERGLVPVCASFSLEEMRRFQLGGEIRVTVGLLDEQGSYVLAVEDRPADSSASKFDQEFNKLNYVLTNNTPRVKGNDVKVEMPSIEERMEAWISKAEKRLSRLRKNRGKRLSEEFYNNKR